MSIREGSIYKRAYPTISRLLDAYESWLIAFSGGPDSVCLLDILTRYCNAGKKHRIGLAYVNHALRDPQELTEEEVFIHQCAKRYACEEFILTCDPDEITDLSKERGKGLEEAARVVRYQKLEACRLANDYSCIITAHNQDDIYETLIMRFFRGAGVSGLCGIAEKNDTLIRPMLDISKEDVLTYISEKGLSYSLDTTNLQDDYERNSIRQRVIPLIHKLYPGYRKALTHMMIKMRYSQEYLDHSMQIPPASMRKEYDGFSLSAVDFNAMMPYARLQSIYYIWERVAEKGTVLPFSVVQEMVETGIGAAVETKTKFIYDGVLCYVSKEHVFWKREVVPNAKNKYLKVVDRDVINLFSGYDLTRSEVGTVDPEAICIRKEHIHGTMVVRSYIEGDEIVLRNGTKKILRLFNDWKVPREERWMIPVIADTDGIIGVLGRAFGYNDRIALQSVIDIQDKSGILLWALKIVSVGESVEFE